MDTLNLRQRILLNQPHIESASGDIANFTTDMKAPLKECKVYFKPIQEGEGNSSPDNVRNIIGWNGVNLYKCKKNLVLENSIIDNFYVRGAVTQTGTEIGSTNQASGYKCTDFIKVLPNTTYTITFTWINAAAAGLAFYSNTKVENTISGISMMAMKKSPYTFTTPSNCNYIRFTSKNLNSFMGLVQGSVELTEDVYDGNIISTSWSDEVGTVYGGYIDWVIGELVGIYTYQTFDGDEPWSAYGSDVYRFALQPSNGFPKKKNGQNNIICDSYSAHGYNSNYYVALSGTQALYPTAQDLKDALSQNPIHACYELLEPVHYQLTPQQLLTFKDENNIWSDTNGQIEVKFWTH